MRRTPHSSRRRASTNSLTDWLIANGSPCGRPLLGGDRLGAEGFGDGDVDRVVDRHDYQGGNVQRERLTQAGGKFRGSGAAPRRHAKRVRQLDEIRVAELDVEVASEPLVL